MRHDATSILRRALCALAFVGLPVYFGAACASQQQEDGDILESTEDGEQGENQAVEDDEGNDSNQSEENMGDEQQGEDGAEMNNDVSDDTQTIDDAPLAEGNSLNAPLNTPPENQVPALDPAANAVNAVPMNAANTANAVPANGAAPAAPADGAPQPGGRVRYAKSGGVQVTSEPGGGNPVYTLEQGDHPVTWEENGYLKLANGMYIPMDAMSDQGVGRGNSAAPWK